MKRWSSSVDVFCEDQAVNVHVLFSSWRQIKRQKHKKGEKEREKNLNEIQSESKLAALDFDFGCCRLLTSGQMNRKKPFCSDQLKKTRNQNVKKVATTGERKKVLFEMWLSQTSADLKCKVKRRNNFWLKVSQTDFLVKGSDRWWFQFQDNLWFSKLSFSS